MKRALAICLLVAAGGFAFAQGVPGERSLTILYTGAALGKLTPCACSAESDIGGLLRRDSALAQLQKSFQGALLLDAGASFKDATDQGRMAADALLKAYRALGYGAVAIGPGDLIYGRDFLEARASAGLFVSNLTFKRPAAFAGPARMFTRGVAVRALALVDPADVYAGAQADVNVAPIAGYLTSHPANGALTVVLCSMKREKAMALAAAPQVDIVINANPENDVTVEPPFRFENGKVYAEAAIYGSRVGVLQLALNGPTIRAATNSQVALDKSYAPGPRVKPILDAFEAQTKKAFLDSLAGKPPFDPNASPYAGSEACKTCHAKANAAWEASRHSHAWASLQRVGKTFDPECIDCHVVGWRKPGGFYSEADSPHLTNVGCEACHGPGKAHIAAQGKVRGDIARSSTAICGTCHNAERAPKFQAAVGWPKIAH